MKESIIIEILINLKNDSENGIRTFIVSQNFEFKWIRENEETYKKIWMNFKIFFVVR